MFKPNDLAVLRWTAHLWDSHTLVGTSSVGKKDDIVLIVEAQNWSVVVQALHPVYGLKWISNISLNLLKRAEDV